MRRPDDTQRLLICGRTGSGKSHAALMDLSTRALDQMPWVVVDFKGEDIVSKIPVTAPWKITDDPPTEPGLYVVRAEIEDSKSGGPVDQFLTKIYRQGRTGTLIDEGMMLGHNCRGLRLLLTQGRAKSCPLIICTQRPVFLDRYAWSESEFIEVFHLQLADDQDTVLRSLPRDSANFDDLVAAGDFHSYWFDVKAGTVEMLEPGPDFDVVYERLLTALPVYQQEEILGLPRRRRL